MRLWIAKKHHQQLLLETAASLGSSSPKDALEHILNCWVQPTLQPQPQSPPVVTPTESDDLDLLVSWNE